MLTMSTDLVVPTGVDVVGVYIVRVEGAKRTVISSNEVTAEYSEDGIRRVRLPGTLAITSDADPSTTVQIRVVAYDAQRVPVAMREARVLVPTEDLKALPMPLLWLNTEDVLDANPGGGGPTPIAASTDLGFLAEPTTDQASVDAFGRFRSDFCGEERTLDETGACTSIVVDPAKLDPWREKAFRDGIVNEVARGTQSPTGLGTDGDAAVSHDFCKITGAEPPQCFNLAGCFPGSDPDPRFVTVEVTPDRIQGLGTSECFVSLESMAGIRNGLSRIKAALAVKTTREQGALCTRSGDCYVPVDDKFVPEVDREKRRILLPPGVCRKASKGSVISIVASPLCDRKQVDEPVCVDAEGVAVDAGCRDGSGWNGDLDELPAGPDGGGDGGGPCASLARATGFWVDPAYTVVASSTGQFFVFEPGQVSGACLRGAPLRTVERSTQAEGIGYRVFGGAGLFAFMGVGASSVLRSSGLLVLQSSGGALDSRPQPFDPGLWAAGAFFEQIPITGASGPGAVFLSSQPQVQVARVDSAATQSLVADPTTAGSNLIGRAEQDQNGVWQLVTTAADELELRHVMLPKSTGTVAVATVSQSDLPLAGYVPLALAHSDRSGATAALATTASTTLLLGVDLDAFNDGLSKRTEVGGVAPAEMTLALAVANDGVTTYPFFGVGDTLYTVDAQDIPLAVAQSFGGTIHAVQVVGSDLYWLESDASGATTLRHVLLENGLFPPR